MATYAPQAIRTGMKGMLGMSRLGCHGRSDGLDCGDDCYTVDLATGLAPRNLARWPVQPWLGGAVAEDMLRRRSVFFKGHDLADSFGLLSPSPSA